jgi:hypothetical protein
MTVRTGYCLAALSLIVAPLTSHAQAIDDRLHDYLRDEFSPFAMASVTLGAGVGTLQRSPRWWDKDEGFGYRLGTNFAAHTADITVRDGLAALMHQNVHYVRCGCRNVFARTGHAIVSSFLAHNDNGDMVLGVPQIAGGYAAGFTTSAFYGHGYGWKDGLRLGTESLGTHAGMNMVKEFIFPLFTH